MPTWKELLEQFAVIQAALVPFVILTMRALIVMSLCTAMVAELAFAKQNLTRLKYAPKLRIQRVSTMLALFVGRMPRVSQQRRVL